MAFSPDGRYLASAGDESNPFARHAFEQAGGEIIFSLPNGLQGYMLVDSKDNRIDVGPTEIVSDSKKIAGTPAIVNGLSCMACHQHGMIGNLKDTVRDGTSVAGDARDMVRQLYVQPEAMDRLVKKDEERFVRSLDEAMGPFLKIGADKDKNSRDFPEPISAIARWYLVQELGALEASRELGLSDVKKLQAAIQANGRLEGLGLGPLAQEASIKRETWETLKSFVSPFQEAARELKTGTPKRYQ